MPSNATVSDDAAYMLAGANQPSKKPCRMSANLFVLGGSVLLAGSASLKPSSNISNVVLKGAFYLIELQLLQDEAFTASGMQPGKGTVDPVGTEGGWRL